MGQAWERGYLQLVINFSTLFWFQSQLGCPGLLSTWVLHSTLISQASLSVVCIGSSYNYTSNVACCLFQVRRGVGTVASTRRLGPVQSKRIYTLLTSRDPNLTLV